MGKNKIPQVEASKSQKRIPVQNYENTKITFEFLYDKWLKSVDDKNFTTFLSDNRMYAKYITYVFSTLIPTISKELIIGKNETEWKHCHAIQDGEALGRYNKAIEKIHGINTSNLELWQFGITGGVRLIGHLTGEHIVIPLLIDYHHLGYPSEKYNQADTKKYKFCPITAYVK